MKLGTLAFAFVLVMLLLIVYMEGLGMDVTPRLIDAMAGLVVDVIRAIA